MRSDPIGDFLARIKNSYLARHASMALPYGKILDNLAKILKREKFIKDVKVETLEGQKMLMITLSYPDRKPAVSNLKRVSKPGLRVYATRKHIPKVYGGLGIAVLSTSKGLMTGSEAVKNHLGGEVICKIW